jgi:hypothetical protein
MRSTEIGTVVRCQERDYKVTEIDVEYGWVSGVVRRKDGSFGTGKRNLYNQWSLNETAPTEIARLRAAAELRI